MAVTYIHGCSAQDSCCPTTLQTGGIIKVLVWIRGRGNINPLLSFKCTMIHYLRQDPISGALGKLCERQAEVV